MIIRCITASSSVVRFLAAVAGALAILVSGCGDRAASGPAPSGDGEEAAANGSSAPDESGPAASSTPDTSTGSPAQPGPSAGEPGEADAAPSDGFPVGMDTPEGAAMELARAVMANDADKFLGVCMPSGFRRQQSYDEFLASVREEMDRIHRGEMDAPAGPRRITRVFRARHLTADGPASAGYAMNLFNDVMFVDIEAELDDGNLFTNRTLVFQLGDGSWRVMPRPDLFPSLSTGLNEESDSTEVWAP